MSRNTITITTPHGAKVRTVASRRYFVVSEVPSDGGVYRASVVKRTDSAVAAQRELNRYPTAHLVYKLTVERTHDGTPAKLTARELHWTDVKHLADAEKVRRAAVRSS